MTECNHVWQCDDKNICLSDPPQVRYDCIYCDATKYESLATAEVPMRPQPTDIDYRFGALANRIQILENQIRELDQRLPNFDYLDMLVSIEALKTKMLEKDKQIANLQEANTVQILESKMMAVWRETTAERLSREISNEVSRMSDD